MTSALLRWEAEVGGERGHGAGGLLAAVANVGALAVICPEAKTHEPALPATSCSLQTPGLVSTTTSHKNKRPWFQLTWTRHVNQHKHSYSLQ